MSDVREAVEALENLRKWADDHPAGIEDEVKTWHSTVQAALQSQTAPAVPEGWMLVPIEPTSHMQESGAKVIRFSTTAINKLWIGNHVYKAMLAAAPQPDHSPDAGKVVQGKNRYGLDVGYFSRLIAREFGDLSNFRPDEFARVCARMAATADASVLQEKEFRATPAADGGEVEPVAWAVFADNGNIRIWGRKKPESLSGAVPLYLSPAVKESLTVQSEPIGYADPDSLTDYRAGDRLHIPVYQPDASAEWEKCIPVYLRPAQPRNDLDSEDQKGMERIVEAVAHIGIDFGYGKYELEQCHIDRAREIKESLDRLRASQQEGGEE